MVKLSFKTFYEEIIFFLCTGSFSFDGMGYIGAAVTEILSGWLTDLMFGDGMQHFIYAGVLMLLLCNYKPEKREYE